MKKIQVINHKSSIINPALRAGFTLVEIVVSIAILATLIGGVFVAINPQRQVRKAQDSERQRDLQEIKKALDLYYQDKSCYPSSNSPFVTALDSGGEWKEGTTVYMKKVPVDPRGAPYIYSVDTAACPQWNVTFAKLSAPSNITTTCALSSVSECTPQGFDNTWACVTSGSTNCGQLVTTALSTPTPAPPTSTPTSTPTPTPSGGSGTFNVAMNTDPWATYATIVPYPAGGGLQQFSLTVQGTNPVTSVVARVATDSQIRNYTLVLTSGTANNGVWSTSWTNSDTINTNYVISPTMTNVVGTQASFDLSLK